MNEKLKTMLLASTRAQMKAMFEDDGLSIATMQFGESGIDEDLDAIFTRFLEDREDDLEYNRLERESKAIVKAEFNRIIGEIRRARLIVDAALNG